MQLFELYKILPLPAVSCGKNTKNGKGSKSILDTCRKSPV